MAEHGTRARYAKGCRCGPCTAANRAYARQRYRIERGYDEGPTVPAEPVAAELRRLMAGYSLRTIAAVTGLSRSSLQLLANGERDRVLRTTAEAIEAFEFDLDYRELAPRTFVPAAPVVRKLHQLYHNGWTKAMVARELGRKTDTVQFATRQRVHARIAAEVDELWRTRLTAATTLARARGRQPGERSTRLRVLDQLIEVHLGAWTPLQRIIDDLAEEWDTSDEAVRQAYQRLRSDGDIEAMEVDKKVWVRCTSGEPI